MHPLDAWLTEKKKTRAWLANELGVTEATISRLIAGRQWPRRNLAAEIARLTKRAVTPNDFLDDDSYRQRGAA